MTHREMVMTRYSDGDGSDANGGDDDERKGNCGRCGDGDDKM